MKLWQMIVTAKGSVSNRELANHFKTHEKNLKTMSKAALIEQIAKNAASPGQRQRALYGSFAGATLMTSGSQQSQRERKQPTSSIDQQVLP